jgi:hypothetical protein
VKLTTPFTIRSSRAWLTRALFFCFVFALLGGASEVTDFNQLYGRNCAGCHGSDGRFSAARPLNDPLYLNLISSDNLRKVIRQGVASNKDARIRPEVRWPAHRRIEPEGKLPCETLRSYLSQH